MYSVQYPNVITLVILQTL